MANTNDKAYRAAKGFQVVCFSLYDDDIRELEAKVAQLKRMGVTNANKSALVRIALGHVDLEIAARELALVKHHFAGQPVRDALPRNEETG